MLRISVRYHDYFTQSYQNPFTDEETEGYKDLLKVLGALCLQAIYSYSPNTFLLPYHNCSMTASEEKGPIPMKPGHWGSFQISLKTLFFLHGKSNEAPITPGLKVLNLFKRQPYLNLSGYLGCLTWVL